MGVPTEGLRSRRSDMVNSEKQNEEDAEEEKRGEGCKIWWHQAGGLGSRQGKREVQDATSPPIEHHPIRPFILLWGLGAKRSHEWYDHSIRS